MPATPEPTHRLFFALWPDETVRQSLAAAAGKCLRRTKRVPADKLHITLAFPGVVTETVQQCLEAGADRIVSRPFELQVDRVGYWPRPRIVWLGPTRIPEGLWSLVAALRGVLEECGLVPETRPYLPHITLARKANPGAVAGDFEPIPWSIRNFCLVESVTDPAGAKYLPLRSWELEG
jgi:2'-5' RNA ligase